MDRDKDAFPAQYRMSGGDWTADIFAFMLENNQSVPFMPKIPESRVVRELRRALVKEEYDELRMALLGFPFPVSSTSSGGYDSPESQLTDIADACADLVYVVVGTALAYGIDLRPVFDAVHKANMTKAGGLRADGKVQKHEGFTRPDIKAILAKQDPL